MAQALHPRTGRAVAVEGTDALAARYAAVRRFTEALCEGLTADDCQMQSMADASPVKWHLAHTSWFFETFVLGEALADYRAFHEGFAGLFNSYYHSIGPQFPRPQRGVLSRPSLEDVRTYRAHVDAAVARLLARGGAEVVRARVELGLHHEQQHQELILTDLKHALSLNPLQPAYRRLPAAPASPAAPLRWIEQPGLLAEVGHGGAGFAFDNECPRHREWLEPHAIASRPVTNAEYLDFIRDGGYRTPTLWLSDGWLAVEQGGWSRPLYWNEALDAAFTLGGTAPLRPDEPVCHLSYYEAEAYARWADARLPREGEWEAAASGAAVEGNFVESGRLHPRPSAPGHADFFGNVWEWTSSAYAAYPGFRAGAGALGEYNGKFMSGQFVLRGGSCVSSASHLRASYRNFFPPQARWQFSGLRLARDVA